MVDLCSFTRDQPWDVLRAVAVPSKHVKDDCPLDAARIGRIHKAIKKPRFAPSPAHGVEGP